MLKESFGVRVLEESLEDGLKTFHLLSGNKSLALLIDIEGAGAHSFLESIKDAQDYDGSTTAIYREALKILQREADKIGFPIDYRFITKNEIMALWLLHPEKGLTVFDRDEIFEDKDGQLVAETRIYPNE